VVNDFWSLHEQFLMDTFRLGLTSLGKETVCGTLVGTVVGKAQAGD